MQQTENIIIGAGPAGLAVAGRLKAQGIPFEILEKSNRVANAWHQHYDRLHLHTVNEFSHLPHLPFPEHFPQYIPKQQLCDYYDSYIEKMGIQPHYEEEVVSVEKAEVGWVTHTQSGKAFLSRRVIVCTGYNRVPVEPSWPGMEDFQGSIQHSRFYKNGKGLEGKRVLVVGMGNTGAELAIDLHEHGAIPFISVRSPVNIILRDPFGRPVQKTARILGKLPTWLGDALGKFTARLTVGDLRPYGLQRPDLAPAAQLRKKGKTPVIDVGTVDLIKQGIVKILPGIERFTESGIVFSDGKEHPFDAVVLATGYRPRISEFIKDTEGMFNEHGTPKALWMAEHPGLYFLGFDVYANGILTHINQGSEKIVEKIAEESVEV
jgi:cation diffusion facilitator CzcD-associated flavoprotein CzcO